MIRTLQIRFVKTAMTAITVLLLVVICAISGIYAFDSYTGVKTMAGILAENGGVPLPREAGMRPGAGEFDESFDEEWADDQDNDSDGDPDSDPDGDPDGDPDEDPYEDFYDEDDGGIRGGRYFARGRRGITPDNAMAARFFLVRFTREGEIDYTDTSKIYYVTSEEADEMALDAVRRGRESGITDRFLYFVQDKDDGKIVVFMDISSEISSVLSVVMISLAIGVICWILMFILVSVLSRRAIAPIAENIVRQKQFVTNAGHELKTPLAIIMANTEALELFNGESKWTRNIKSQTQRLSVLMQNLLTLSKMDEAGLELPMEEVDLGAMTAEAAAGFEEPAAEKKIRFRVETEEVRVKANKETMKQLVSILLDNAVKYTPEGGEIAVFVRREGKYAVIRQQNTVCPEDAQGDPERLFDRFYRKDDARTQKKGGYGIGLSAARAIAAANNAEITARYINQESIVFEVKTMI